MNVWDALNLYKEGGSSSVGKKKKNKGKNTTLNN